MVKRIADVEVMVIDDEPVVRRALTKMLTAIGVKGVVESTHGGHALFEITSADPSMLPNLILCDLEMEVMGGLEFLAELRGHVREDISTIPVIIATGHTEAEMVKAAASQDIDGYLVKPFNTRKLEARIQRILPSIPERE